MPSPLLTLRNITKRYDAVAVLRDVDFELRAGEVHVLAGENGAGKSTLIKIIAGAVRADRGSIAINGAPVRIATPLDAVRYGVAVIHQELSLVDSMSAAENLALGYHRSMLRSPSDEHAHARAALHHFLPDIDINARVDTLSLGARQLIEIARALASNAQIVIMDEPTSALRTQETEQLLQAVQTLRNRGTGIIYISHRLEEIMRVADRVTVLRDGVRIETIEAHTLTPKRLIHAMIGREISAIYPPRHTNRGDVLLRAHNLTVHGTVALENVHLDVRAGEILGLAGLQGSGTSEALQALYGVFGARASMMLKICGADARVQSPREAVAHGIALVGADRAALGIVPSLSIEENIMLTALPTFSRTGWMPSARIKREATQRATDAGMTTANLAAPITSLSGGNQQKGLIARAMATDPRVLLLDDPTRGVDVGVKRDLYDWMNIITREGRAIILASSDLPELLAMSDRILVFHRGVCVAEFTHDEATAATVLGAMLNCE
jgi:ribose transport system ATP-binding protein